MTTQQMQKTGKFKVVVGTMGGSTETWKNVWKLIASLDPKDEDGWTVYEEVIDEFGDKKHGRILAMGFSKDSVK